MRKIAKEDSARLTMYKEYEVLGEDEFITHMFLIVDDLNDRRWFSDNCFYTEKEYQFFKREEKLKRILNEKI